MGDSTYFRKSEANLLGKLAKDRIGNPEANFITNGDRLRVSLTKPELATRFPYDQGDRLYQTVENVGGTVSYNPDRDSALLNPGTAEGNKIYRSTNEFFHYQSYRESYFGGGGILPPHQDGQRCRMGPFYEDNGIFFERDTDGQHYAVRRSKASGNVIDHKVPRVNDENLDNEWNIDNLSGEGGHRNPSGIEFDESMIQMIKWGFEWYGAGDAWIGIKIKGKIYKCHIFEAGNKLKEPIFGEPTVPLRWEIENVSAVSSAEEMEIFGASASVEAGFNENFGFPYSASRAANPFSLGTSLNRIFTIRPMATFKSKPNRTKILTKMFTIFAQTQSIYFEIRRDCPITNEATNNWSPVESDSAVEYSLDAEGASGGRVIYHDYAQAGGGKGNPNAGGASKTLDSRIPLVIRADGTIGNKNIAIFAQRITGSSNTDVYGGFNWLEVQ